MSGVLIIACIGAMQSWGTRSRFHDRDTEREPTKSGIIGIICSALGRGRGEKIDDLVALKMSVRVDIEGKVAKDYQTVMTSEGKVDSVGYRHHLQDAIFLVALEGDFELLKTIHNALKTPKWQLSLGRKSYLASVPFYIKNGLIENETVTVLQQIQLIKQTNEKYIRLVTDSDNQTTDVRQDVPISFKSRTFAKRYISNEMIEVESNFKGEKLCIFPY